MGETSCDTIPSTDVSVVFEDEENVLFEDVQKSDLHFIEETRLWIGDPCYAPGLEEVWPDFCDALFGIESGDPDCPGHVLEHNGVEFLVGSTAYGDGCYDVSTGGSCGVDAGLLSVIPAGAFGLDPESGNDYGGVFVSAAGRCYVDEDHTLHAGRIDVVTKEKCGNCGEIEGSCSCERCWDCDEWEDYCTCSDYETCVGCGYIESECECEEED